MPHIDKPFVVHIQGNRHRRFALISEAVSFCSAVFTRTKIVLSIVDARESDKLAKEH